MPLFEYECKKCDHRFETLVRGNETPECPSCHGTALEQRLSAFAAHTNGRSSSSAAPAMGGCGACGDPRGPGACSMN